MNGSFMTAIDLWTGKEFLIFEHRDFFIDERPSGYFLAAFGGQPFTLPVDTSVKKKG